MAQHGHLSREEKKKIRVERKKLRKDLKKQGITKRREFEEIAQMLGLVYWDDYPRFLGWLWRLRDFFFGLGLGSYFSLIVLVLGILFAFSVLANQKGNFTVTLSDQLMSLEFELSDDHTFEKAKVRLVSDTLKEVNAYSISDLPDNLDEGEGSHNMDNVVCYTWWIRNNGTETVDFNWYLVKNAATLNVDEATWLMLYDEDGMVLYSKPAGDGGREKIAGCTNQALAQQCSRDDIFTPGEGGTYEVSPISYQEENIVASGKLNSFAPGSTHKYTIAIWVEGDDPQCTETMIGGHAGFAFKYITHGEEEEIFDSYGYDPDDISLELRLDDKSPITQFIQKLKNRTGNP